MSSHASIARTLNRCRWLKKSILFLVLRVCLKLEGAEEIQWKAWSDSIFAQAKEQGRFVLLDLGTGWCHWCHVMEAVTYRDPAVIELIPKRYIAYRVVAHSRHHFT